MLSFGRKIKLYPKGKGAELGNYLSLYLALADPLALSTCSKIYAQIILLILDQKQANHHFGKGIVWSLLWGAISREKHYSWMNN